MALHPSMLAKRISSSTDLMPALLIAVVVIAALLVATAVFGVRLTGPSYDIVPDPAGTLPF